MKKIALCTALLVIMAFSYHAFFVSIMEGEYNKSENKFQFSVKFIGHDLEEALVSAGLPELNLGTEKELTTANSYIQNYINSRFNFICNDKAILLKMVGKEVGNDDFIYCFLESAQVQEIRTIEIENTLLTEVFPNQENIVHIKIEGELYSFSCNNDQNQYKINL